VLLAVAGAVVAAVVVDYLCRSMNESRKLYPNEPPVSLTVPLVFNSPTYYLTPRLCFPFRENVVP